MKKAIRFAAIIAAFTLIVSTFPACTISEKEDTSSTVPSVSEKDETSEVETETDKTEEVTEEKATEEQISEKIEVDSTETILNLICKYPVGTAGSTAKSVDIAIRLINFTENCKADEVKSEAEKFKEDFSDTDIEMYSQCLDEIDYMARKLLNGDTESIKQYIEDSDEKYDEGNYSTEKYEAVYDIIK